MSLRGVLGVGVISAVVIVSLAAAQAPKVRDATYRGTLVCDKLPFFETAAREALEIKIRGSEARYVHVVRERAETSFELGQGIVDGDKISLNGSWTGEEDSYEASYSGTFVRRSATLTGEQTWQHDGKTHVRKCTGAIKRPFAVFLPGEAPPEKNN